MKNINLNEYLNKKDGFYYFNKIEGLEDSKPLKWEFDSLVDKSDDDDYLVYEVVFTFFIKSKEFEENYPKGVKVGFEVSDESEPEFEYPIPQFKCYIKIGLFSLLKEYKVFDFRKDKPTDVYYLMLEKLQNISIELVSKEYDK